MKKKLCYTPRDAHITNVMIYTSVTLTESTTSRDRDSDDDWEEKEASRTISVKFTEDVSEAKEVRLCCCTFVTYRRAPSRHTNYFKTFRYKVPIRARDVAISARSRFSKVGNWFSRKLGNIFSRQRAYLALSSILVALE